jgi:hypothetical protein
LKSTEKILPIHQAQLLTYMKLAKKSVGLLINFNVPLLTQGISGEFSERGLITKSPHSEKMRKTRDFASVFSVPLCLGGEYYSSVSRCSSRQGKIP